jgi:glyoxylase-like metal-dependent hydrolase (beta-lactamase superfamily II)
MRMICFSTGSQANGYALRGENETLLIEAGVPYKKILPMLDFRTIDICGLIISHSHS